MIIWALGQILEKIDEEQFLEEERSAVFLVGTEDAKRAMELAGMVYEGEINPSEVGFCKLETQQECLAGSLCIPKFIDMLGKWYKMQFFINRRHIVIVDDDGFASRLIRRIRRSKTQQGDTRERFLYNVMAQFMSRDLEMLGQYEKLIMDLEENVTEGKTQGFQSKIVPVRRELLTLRGYYDELMDMGRELEANENRFFAKKQLKYFGTISDRADRFMGKTAHLLEYAQQVRDAYQAAIDAEQNKNMQFLTVLSAIFFPLTLITGWYGMNFRDMPELDNGYPGVILLSMAVIAFCIFIFKKKKIL